MFDLKVHAKNKKLIHQTCREQFEKIGTPQDGKY